MQIGGLEKLTLIDYPGKIACTVFLIGCNFRCPFCYSSELVLPEKIKKQPIISEKEFFAFLKQRKSLLEGVVICGGEPTIHKDLPVFIKKINVIVGYFSFGIRFWLDKRRWSKNSWHNQTNVIPLQLFLFAYRGNVHL